MKIYKYKFLLFLLFCYVLQISNAQTIYFEDFESGVLPEEWELESQASDGGWNVGSAASLSSAFYSVIDNGSAFMIGTNDDDCNCDKINDRLISPIIDLSGYSFATLSFDMFYSASSYQGVDERAELYISFDKVDWIKLKEFEGNDAWEKEFVDLSPFGEQQFYMAFAYSDGGGWLYGCVIDNITISVPLVLDCALNSKKGLLYGEIDDAYHIPIEIKNLGATTITELEIAYSINGQLIGTELFKELDLVPFEERELEFVDNWYPQVKGINIIELEIVSVNAVQDEDFSNDTFQFDVEIFDRVTKKNIIDDILYSTPNIIEIANSLQLLDKPTDLDFFPILGKNELWLLNERVENSGGSTVIVRNAISSPTDFEHQVDGNAWHFMSLPTGIVFSNDNHNFASSPGVQDANHNGGTFTGPTLWSSDPNIYAKPSGGNGSHLDMLHGSPYSMGIAHEQENVFWVYDNWHKDIVRYDFAEDHGPGNDDHSDGIVRRYKNLGINGINNNIPNHMIMDKDSGWLYFVDNGNARVLRLDINSGIIGNDLPLLNEELEQHVEVLDFNFEVIIDTGITYPCGIDLIENRLLVTDYSNGDIIVYDTESSFSELGRIFTDRPGITGLVVGPEGNIWYTNREQNTLSKIEMGDAVSTSNIDKQDLLTVYPNPVEDNIYINLDNTPTKNQWHIFLLDDTGKELYSANLVQNKGTIDVSQVQAGLYILKATDNKNSVIKKIVIN